MIIPLLLSRRKGIFGCTHTQVQANVVAKQLQIISHIVLSLRASAIVALSITVTTEKRSFDEECEKTGAASIGYF